MTTIFLAYSQMGKRAWLQHDWINEPVSALVAFPFVDEWEAIEDEVAPETTMLDSGAFSAWKSGTAIDEPALMEECRNPRWTYSVALDVIGDGDLSRESADRFRHAGLPSMPTFHIGEPWELLQYYCDHWDFVGFGSKSGEITIEETTRFYDGVFARCWPHRFHAFGRTAPRLLDRYPFFSADSTTWMVPARYNNISYLNGKQQHIAGWNGDKIDAIRGEMLHYAKLQRRYRSRWARELSRFDEVAPC